VIARGIGPKIAHFSVGGESKMSKDPVCGMQVDERKAAAKSSFGNREYYFCSQDCKRQFDQHPERYAQEQTTSGKA
jgi:YHS domain-containing protein